MKNAALCLTTFSLTLLTACGGPTLPKGPGGGDNTVEIIVGESEVNFDQLSAIARVASGTVTVSLGGSADPIKDAVDDEYSITLDLEFARAALDGISNGASFTVSSTVTFPDFNSGETRYKMLPEPGPSDAIQLISLKRSCFCGGSGGTHVVTGEIVIERVSDTAIAGSVALTFTGDIQNSDATKVVVNSSFDLPINDGTPAI